MKEKKISINTKGIFLIELALYIVLTLLDHVLDHILLNNNLILRNSFNTVVLGLYTILMFLIILQIIIIIYKALKNTIFKGILVVFTIVAFSIYIWISVIVASMGFQPEYVVEKDNKKMVACVNSYLKTNVTYYDYVNPFVRSTKERIYEDYSDSGNPFKEENKFLPDSITYYDDDGNVIKYENNSSNNLTDSISSK